jgi:molybdopterin-guanine dinucleotide biosynthesis protein A
MNEMGVTLAILAGGRGERMGKAKGLLQIGDQPILSHLLEKFAWQGPTLLVTSPGRERPPGAEKFDVEVVDPAEGMGPLRGVLTALENLKTEVVVVASVDMPLIEREQLLWLVERIRPEAWGMMIKVQEVEPLPCILRRSCAAIVREHLDGGNRSMNSLTAIEGFSVLRAPGSWNDDVWTNLNEPADLAAFEKRLKD